MATHPCGELETANVSQGCTVIYARVSSADQKGDLDRQVAQVLAWATELRYSVDRVVTEVGSALNGHRFQLQPELAETRYADRLVK
ncbi:resolvase, partial [mine drainage metagenome]